MTRNTDHDRFRKLTYGHYDRLYRLAYSRLHSREDALDVVQEAYIKAYKAIASLESEEKIAQWLSKILLNVLRDFCRGRKREVPSTPWTEDIEAIDPAQMPDQLDRNELSHSMKQALANLPDGFVMAILLREVAEFSYQDIAKILDIPLGTVMSRISRSRKLLREHLKYTAGFRADCEESAVSEADATEVSN